MNKKDCWITGPLYPISIAHKATGICPHRELVQRGYRRVGICQRPRSGSIAAIEGRCRPFETRTEQELAEFKADLATKAQRTLRAETE